ncbi:MAG: insulinase family protein [Pirellulales bacterium]|nr:insulinase family protein [Pirellulales bacterium]
MEFRSHTLPNGLEIVAECNGEAHSTALGFFVKTGSRDENDATAGVSHFLEHMTFKGTPTRSADDVNREFDEMGAHYNAFTNEENTVYYAAVLPEFQDHAVELLADILRPSLRDDDFDMEKQVIIEEIHMYDDQPPFGADEKCRAAYFGSHPLGRSVLGTVQSITELSVEAMRDYFARRYSPGNVALAASGRVDFDGLVAAARRYCGRWQPCADSRRIEPAAPQAVFQAIHKEIATQEYALELAEGPAAGDDDRYAAKLLATVLGDDSGSRLYWELVDPGWAEQVSLNHCEYEGAGLMMTYVSCDPEQIAENLQRILDVYRRAEAEGITAAELKTAKSKIRSRIVLSSERPRGRLFTVGADWIYRREYRSVEEDLEKVADVTLDDVTAVLSKYPLRRSTTLAIGPLADVCPPR